MDSADQLLSRQAAGMSCYSVAEEIMPGRTDYRSEMDSNQRYLEPYCPRTQSETSVPAPSDLRLEHLRRH